MTTKKLITLAMSAVMISAAAVSVSAATLTETSPSGNTEVIAHIDGTAPAGITYKITIPDVVDFGTLTQPETADDSYKTVGYNVTLDEVNGLDASTQQISVYVKDQNASIDGDQNFYIANKDNSNIKFKYHVFKVPEAQVAGATSVNANPMTKTVGYYLDGFTTAGEEVDGTLVINQVQLYGKSITDIAGDYSGYMVFYSAVENI